MIGLNRRSSKRVILGFEQAVQIHLKRECRAYLH
jgi:hypothetical protein